MLSAQQPVWNITSAPKAKFRYNDVFFVTQETGWAIRPYENFDGDIEYGGIYKTTDGGTSWSAQIDSSHVHFRCMGFFDSLHGVVFSLGGYSSYYDSLGYDSTLTFETTDGGATWVKPTMTIDGPRPRGLCGMSVVNHDVAYACGRWNGPGFLIKTTDGGKTWKSTDMTSQATMLIDCYFWSPDSGIVVGGTSNDYSLCKSVVLFTSNGGDSWVKRYVSLGTYESCWKISFPSREVGYISLQSNPEAILKTTNNGMTWTRKVLPDLPSVLQGIGFVNDSVGWTGGWMADALQTTNGGKSWDMQFVGENVNRFRFIGDSIGYCAGKFIFKMTLEDPSSVERETPSALDEAGNYPNPFETSTTIRFTLREEQHVILRVASTLGNYLQTLVDRRMPAGEYSIPFSPELPPVSGIYFYTLRCGTETVERRMIRVQ